VAALRALGAESRVARSFVQETLPGVFNGGDLVAHFQFDAEDDWRASRRTIAEHLGAAAIARVDSAAYAGGSVRVGAPGLANGVYRTLLFSVTDPARVAEIHRFETEMLAMPHYIGAIRNAQLSVVREAAGARPWTHVWEQEFADLDGLMGPYMRHPYHWARVDRWFDPECPERLVDTHLCHSFCDLDRSLIG
jgi:hypothetical protein